VSARATPLADVCVRLGAPATSCSRHASGSANRGSAPKKRLRSSSHSWLKVSIKCALSTSRDASAAVRSAVPAAVPSPLALAVGAARSLHSTSSSPLRGERRSFRAARGPSSVAGRILVHDTILRTPEPTLLRVCIKSKHKYSVDESSHSYRDGRLPDVPRARSIAEPSLFVRRHRRARACFSWNPTTSAESARTWAACACSIVGRGRTCGRAGLCVRRVCGGRTPNQRVVARVRRGGCTMRWRHSHLYGVGRGVGDSTPTRGAA
jgi:hypothetical protein